MTDVPRLSALPPRRHDPGAPSPRTPFPSPAPGHFVFSGCRSGWSETPLSVPLSGGQIEPMGFDTSTQSRLFLLQ